MLDGVGATGVHGGDDDGDLRAWAKIRLEDLSAEECIRELAKQFEEFSRQGKRQESRQPKAEESTEEGHDADIVRDHGAFYANLEHEGVGLNKSFLKRLLAFVEEFYERLFSNDISKRNLRATLREKRRLRTLTAALMLFLKRLLAEQGQKDLKQLLEKQIMELVEALKKETNLELCKILQNRLLVLTELKMQLQVMASQRQGIDSHVLFMMLVEHSIAGASLDLHRRYARGFEMGEGYGYTATKRGWEHLFDLGNAITHAHAPDDSSFREIGRIGSTFSMQRDTLYQCALDRRASEVLAVVQSTGRAGAEELGKSLGPKLVVPRGGATTHIQQSRNVAESGVFERLIHLLDFVVRTLAERLWTMTRNAFVHAMQQDVNLRVAPTYVQRESGHAAARTTHVHSNRMERNSQGRNAGADRAHFSPCREALWGAQETREQPYGVQRVTWCVFENVSEAMMRGDNTARRASILEDVTIHKVTTITGPQVQR
ncbi:MAG: hypothetical protein ACTJLK_00700 [Anaplasma sp.]